MKTSEDALDGQMSELSITVDKKEDAKDPKIEDPLSFSSKCGRSVHVTVRRICRIPVWTAAVPRTSRFEVALFGFLSFEIGVKPPFFVLVLSRRRYSYDF